LIASQPRLFPVERQVKPFRTAPAGYLEGSGTVQVEELRDLLQEKSIRRGRFTLASGDVSNYYCDTKSTTLSPRGSLLVGEVLLPLVCAHEAEAVGGLAIGALFISTPIVYASQINDTPVYGFAVRQGKKEHGLLESLEESHHPDGKPLLSPGRRVVVVDDVVTKGGSVLKAVTAVLERGCDIRAVISLVDRKAGGRSKIEERGLRYLALFSTDDTGELHIEDDAHRIIRDASPAIRTAAGWR
jgi:orotate phosphoribosyltransferase